jgi:hypothetical protein
MGCPIKLGTVGIDPLVIMTENYTPNDGRISYKLSGFSVYILQFVCKKINLTTVFLSPSLNMEIDLFVKEITELDEGLSEVLAGSVPLLSVVVTSSFDDKIPYAYEKVKMLVPCPKAIPGNQKLLIIFSLSVWLTTGLVLLLRTAVFWCAGNVPYRYVSNETHISVTVALFHNAWAVCGSDSSTAAHNFYHRNFFLSLRLFLFRY